MAIPSPRFSTKPGQTACATSVPIQRSFSPHVAIPGYVRMLTATSSAMIYGLLPVYIFKALGLGIASIGLIEGPRKLPPFDKDRLGSGER